MSLKGHYMLDHYVMFKLKPECKGDLDEVVRQLQGLQADVPAIRFSEVLVDQLHGPNAFDLMYHMRVDDRRAFREDYMPHPKHVPVQRYIEARVCGIADIDVEC